jgi:sugar-specific transcriptional regulator TrmB
MSLEESLTQLNLNDREAKIYTALLELGQATPLQLAKKTGLKRPTVYLDLESLRRKRLAGLAPSGKRLAYAAEPPERLVRGAHEMQKVAQDVLPLLKAIENRAGTKPLVRLYTDPDDIIHVWLNETYNSAESAYMSNFSRTMKLYPDLGREFVVRIKRGIIKNTRAIVTDSVEDIAYARAASNSTHPVRIMPKGLGSPTDIQLWGNHVGLFSIEQKYLLVISDPAISQAFRSNFELAWKYSRDPKTLK